MFWLHALNASGVGTGQCILTLEAGRDRWFTFTLREDLLRGIAIGSSVQLVSARGSTITGRVTECARWENLPRGVRLAP